MNTRDKRRCAKCHAFLRAGNNSPLCDPCSTPPQELVDPPLPFERPLAEIEELMEQAA